MTAQRNKKNIRTKIQEGKIKMPEEISSRNENIRKEEDKCARKRANYRRAAVVSLTVTLASLILSIPKVADHFLTFWYGPSRGPAVMEIYQEKQRQLRENLEHFGHTDLGDISNLEYALSAQINGNEIRFYRGVAGKYNILDVIEPGGAARYVANGDFSVDSIKLVNTLPWCRWINVGSEPIDDINKTPHADSFRRAQKQFDSYLANLMKLHKQDIIITGEQSDLNK